MGKKIHPTGVFVPDSSPGYHTQIKPSRLWTVPLPFPCLLLTSVIPHVTSQSLVSSVDIEVRVSYVPFNTRCARSLYKVDPLLLRLDEYECGSSVTKNGGRVYSPGVVPHSCHPRSSDCQRSTSTSMTSSL